MFKITTHLVLHTLSDSDFATFKRNVETQKYFWLTPKYPLVVITSDLGKVMKEITAGLPDPATVTFVDMGNYINTVKAAKPGEEFPTVFDH